MTTDQLDRTKIIGGSDIAAIMGLSNWKSPLSLWAEKTGRLVNDLSNFEAAEIGTELEEFVCRKFTKKTGIKLRVDNRTFTHKKYPYMVAHIDRWVVAGDAVFEAKTCSAWKEKAWQGEDIPEDYVLQLNWYLGIVGKTFGYIAVLIGGQKFLHKQIQFDASLFDLQVTSAKTFWEEFVLADVAPMAIALDNDSTLIELFPTAKSNVLSVQGEKALLLNQLVEDRSGGIESIKHAEEELDKIEAQIKQILGESESAETDQYNVSWKNQTRAGADMEKLKADGLYDTYKKISSFRTLRTKLRKI